MYLLPASAGKPLFFFRLSFLSLSSLLSLVAIVDDGTSNTSAVAQALPPWNGWSASGNATGQVVYVNYCRQEDFDALNGMDLTGTIVMCRYGQVSVNRAGRGDLDAAQVTALITHDSVPLLSQIFRGNKAWFAELAGAVGCIIFVDYETAGPQDGQPVYPDGPWATNSTVQRGSVWLGNGDALSPGWPALASGTEKAPKWGKWEVGRR